MSDNKGCRRSLGLIFIVFTALLIWHSHGVGESFASIGAVIGGLLLLGLGTRAFNIEGGGAPPLSFLPQVQLACSESATLCGPGAQLLKPITS
jgi:hypothetical protein